MTERMRTQLDALNTLALARCGVAIQVTEAYVQAALGATDRRLAYEGRAASIQWAGTPPTQCRPAELETPTERCYDSVPCAFTPDVSCLFDGSWVIDDKCTCNKPCLGGGKTCVCGVVRREDQCNTILKNTPVPKGASSCFCFPNSASALLVTLSAQPGGAIGHLADLAVEAGFDFVSLPTGSTTVRVSVIPDFCETNADMILALDGSGSISEPNWDRTKAMTQKKREREKKRDKKERKRERETERRKEMGGGKGGGAQAKG